MRNRADRADPKYMLAWRTSEIKSISITVQPDKNIESLKPNNQESLPLLSQYNELLRLSSIYFAQAFKML